MGNSFRVAASLCFFALSLGAADPAIEQILARLQRLEQENATLRTELTELRRKLEGTPESPPLEERVAVTEQRIEEQQQTKVESSQRVPVRLTGMLLFNAFRNGRNGAPGDFPTLALPVRGSAVTRATMRQTSLGVEVESPYTIFGAQARGQVMVDFYGTFEDYNTPRIRTGFLELQWPQTGVRVGIEKPIVSPRNPTSLAQVLYPALWGAGNLWLWQPQARIEQSFSFGRSEIRAQAGLLQTNDQRALPSSVPPLQPRPAWEGRVGYTWKSGDDRVFEIAPGFHYSRTLIAGTSLPSQLVTGDWRFVPMRQWELTGAFFAGKNAGPIGGLRQGIFQTPSGEWRAVGTVGGWTQLMYRPVDRLRIHWMVGEQDDRNRDLGRGSIGRNFSWAANSILQLSPNVLFGLEFQQIRTDFIGNGTRQLNRYDLALAYLF